MPRATPGFPAPYLLYFLSNRDTASFFPMVHTHHYYYYYKYISKSTRSRELLKETFSSARAAPPGYKKIFLRAYYARNMKRARTVNGYGLVRYDDAPLANYSQSPKGSSVVLRLTVAIQGILYPGAFTFFIVKRRALLSGGSSDSLCLIDAGERGRLGIKSLWEKIIVDIFIR